MPDTMRVCAYISESAARNNIEKIIEKASPAKVVAVIKTNGYGHGGTALALDYEEYEGVYGFAVATADEALELRKNGICKPIIILGFAFGDTYSDLIKNDVRLTVFSYEAAERLDKIANELGKKAYVHVKIDTGMSRIGFQVTEENADEIAKIMNLNNIEIEGVFTHFARADEADKTYMNNQLELFKKMVEMLKARDINPEFIHCCNSAATMDMEPIYGNLVRAGVILYGMMPSDEMVDTMGLKPVMTLKSHIVHIKKLEAGRAISYGGTFVTEKETVVATIPVGYGDGYPRSLSNVGYVIIRGKKAPIIGRVCMDQFMVDVTDIPNVQLRDEVTLIGQDGNETITMEQLGELSGRFNYELACDLAPRVPRVTVP